MDGWLKALISTACVVVIAGGGYYAWSEYQDGLRQDEAKERALAAECRALVRRLSRHDVEGIKGGHVALCINNGYVSEKDFVDAGAGDYVDQFRMLIKDKQPAN